MGCRHRNQIRVWALRQLMGSAVFLGGCDTSREVLPPCRPASAEHWGDALQDSLLQVPCILQASCGKLRKDQAMR